MRLAERPSDSALKADFEKWRSQGPEWELAYEREFRAWSLADGLTEADAKLLAGARRLPWRRMRASVEAPSGRRMLLKRIGAGAAAAVVVGMLGTGVWVANSAPAYATAVGERRLVILSDGSRIELNTDTRVVVRYGFDRRRIDLVQGEALFEVAPSKSRPFTVVAGQTQVKAVGTAFNVRTRGEGVDVLVSKGVVDVQGSGGLQHADLRLTAGMTGSFGQANPASRKASPAEMDRMLAWRYGAIVLDGETLSQAVAEFNRYNIRKLEVADPGIAGLKLGGYFQAGDLNNFVQALRSSFGVSVVEGGDQTLYLSRAR